MKRRAYPPAEKRARREEYKSKQLYWLRWKLRADRPSHPSPSSLTEASRFLPVHVVTDVSQVAPEPIEIALPNGRAVRVQPGFDPATLERVLALANLRLVSDAWSQLARLGDGRDRQVAGGLATRSARRAAARRVGEIVARCSGCRHRRRVLSEAGPCLQHGPKRDAKTVRESIERLLDTNFDRAAITRGERLASGAKAAAAHAFAFL